MAGDTAKDSVAIWAWAQERATVSLRDLARIQGMACIHVCVIKVSANLPQATKPAATGFWQHLAYTGPALFVRLKIAAASRCSPPRAANLGASISLRRRRRYCNPFSIIERFTSP